MRARTVGRKVLRRLIEAPLRLAGLEVDRLRPHPSQEALRPQGVHIQGDAAAPGTQFEGACTVYSGSLVMDSKIGRHSYVGPQCMIGHADIGRFCSIGPRVLMGRGVHPMDMISTSPIFYSTAGQTGTTWAANATFQEHRRTTVGHDVWIGAGAFLADGINVGHGAVVGAGCVVTQNVEPYAIVGGVPGRVIRRRFTESQISTLLGLNWWNLDDDLLKDLRPWFLQGDVDALATEIHRRR